MTNGDSADQPSFGDLVKHVEMARLLPFELLLALMRHGKLTASEAREIFDEMLAALPEQLRDTHRTQFHAVVGGEQTS